MAAQAATDNAFNADATEVEAHVTTTAEARTVLTLIQAAAAAARCLENRIAAQAAANEAATDKTMNADATGVETHVTTIAEARTALALVQATAASRIESKTAAEAAANNALNADATRVEAHVTTIAEALSALTLA